MKQKNFYLVSDGKLRRHENTLYFENEDGKKPIPVNSIYSVYALSSLSITSKALSLLAKEGVCIHFFNYYGYYLGSFYPRETLVSGDMLVKQVECHLDKERRLEVAKAFVEGAILNMTKVLSYYKLEEVRTKLGHILNTLSTTNEVTEVMGAEANARNAYYSAFDSILRQFEFEYRSKRPPKNEVNSMISFGNSLLYSTVLSELYYTQLNPTVSFLHEPFERRFSLALDVAEIFKPLLVDRTIFKLVNKEIIKEGDFNSELEGVLLNDSGRKKFVQAYNEKLNTTIKHRDLKRKVSYQRLIRLECYKLAKHFLGTQNYRPFVIWW